MCVFVDIVEVVFCVFVECVKEGEGEMDERIG